MTTVALVSPAQLRPRSPVADLHACWSECNEKEKDSFDFEPWKVDMEEFLTLMMNSGFCVDVYHPSRVTKCRCMEDLRHEITEEEKDRVIGYLVIYARMGFREQRSLVAEWKRYAHSNKVAMGGTEHRSTQHKVYLLPGSHTHKICKNAVAKIIGKKKTAWASIGKKDGHGLFNRPGNATMKEEDNDLLHDFFLLSMHWQHQGQLVWFRH